MSLPVHLNHVMMTHRCPQCRVGLARSGLWFRSIRAYHCAPCGAVVPMGYVEKVALFALHAPGKKNPA
ncbi:hypothetical protein AIGOOFII_1489 [Methylobacterium marchantiae]|nr:hypothetical protein AIGOOFII_1489 [Methylobacterium marchantiae]